MNTKSLVTFLFALVPAAAACSGATTSLPAEDDDAVATSDALKRVASECKPSACSDVVPMIGRVCDDGASASWKCLKTKTGCDLKLVCPAPGTSNGPTPPGGDGEPGSAPPGEPGVSDGSPSSPGTPEVPPSGGTTCTCPNVLPSIARICDDGSTAPWVCLPNAKNVCAWVTVCGK